MGSDESGIVHNCKETRSTYGSQRKSEQAIVRSASMFGSRQLLDANPGDSLNLLPSLRETAGLIAMDVSQFGEFLLDFIRIILENLAADTVNKRLVFLAIIHTFHEALPPPQRQAHQADCNLRSMTHAVLGIEDVAAIFWSAGVLETYDEPQ